MRQISFCLLGLLLGFAQAESVLWQGNPLPVTVKVGGERRVDFPEPIVDLNVPSHANSLSDILLTPEGRLFWKAQAAFAATRVKAISVTGTLYLLDVSASEMGSVDALSIIDPITIGGNIPSNGSANLPLGVSPAMNPAVNPAAEMPAGMPSFLKKNHTNTPSVTSSTRGTPSTSGAGGTSVDLISLSRFALAHFTGPSRLIPTLNANRISIKKTPQHWLRVIGGRLSIRPLAQWQAGGYYVTAVYVRNLSPRYADFDPRAIRGQFTFVAVLQSRLQPTGQLGDEGLWALVSTLPFDQAVQLPTAQNR